MAKIGFLHLSSDYHGGFHMKQQHFALSSAQPHHFFTTLNYLKPCNHTQELWFIKFIWGMFFIFYIMYMQKVVT